MVPSTSVVRAVARSNAAGAFATSAFNRISEINSCLFNDRLPVTIKFANAVGDVLIAAPIDSERRLPFKFYI